MDLVRFGSLNFSQTLRPRMVLSLLINTLWFVGVWHTGSFDSGQPSADSMRTAITPDSFGE